MDTFVLKSVDGIPVKLDNTLSCGQNFLWEKQDGRWHGCVGNYYTVLTEEGGNVVAECDEAAVPNLRRYLDLDTDYREIEQFFPKHELLTAAAEAERGIRLGRLPFEECVFSFITSANNNIPRIKGLLRRLSAECGQPVAEGIYAFPTAEALTHITEERFKELGFGYRSPYMVKTGRLLADGAVNAHSTDGMDAAEAQKLLRTLPGVGPKVADCILLYGCGRKDIFPVDVWMSRMLEEHFGIVEKTAAKQAVKAQEYFGRYAGIAQLYLFSYIRKLDK